MMNNENSDFSEHLVAINRVAKVVKVEDDLVRSYHDSW